jgi:hypothetical protein
LTKGDHTLYEGLVGYTTGDDLSIMQGGNLSSVYSDNGSVRIVGNDDEHDSNGNLVSDGHGGYKSSTYNVQTSIGLNTAQYSSTDGKPISGTSIEASDSLDTSDPSDPDEHMDKTYNDPVIPSYTTTTMSNYAGKLESVSSTTSADNAYTNGQDPYGNTFYSVDDMIGGIGSAANTKDGISALGKSTNENTMDTNQGQVIDYEDVCGSDPDCDS